MAWWQDTEIDQFKRVVGTPTGQVTMFITEKEVNSVIHSLLEESSFRELIIAYLRELKNVGSLKESEEIELRQKIFPIIDRELRGIEPTFQIFANGILLRLFDELDSAAH